MELRRSGRSTSLVVLIGLAVLLLVLGGRTITAADWPHWRGPNRNGTTVEMSGWTGAKWAAGEPLWQGQVGEGSSSPLVVNQRLYAFGWREGQNRISCLDAGTGKEIWSVSYPSPRYGRHHVGDEGLYAGPLSTPEFDLETGFLYTLSLDGDLHCWDTQQQGRQIWSLNLYDTYEVPQRPDVGRNSRRDYGYTTAPLVHESWLIVEVGSQQGNVMAFDKRTGQQVWASECRDEAGHTGGPVPITVEGIPCVAVLTLRNLVVTRLDGEHAGETMASYPWATHFANNIVTPAVHENYVVITSGYNRSATSKLKITRAGAEKVWEQPVFSKVCTPVIHEGYVYWAWRGVHCLDWETGELRWSGGNVGDAASCILTGDERLLVWANQGNLMLLETAQRSPNEAKILASTPEIFQTDVWPHVVLAEGRLYCKDRDGNLVCLEP